MALSVSIRFDGKDIREKWGIEILSHNILDSPEQDIKHFESKTRDGGISNLSTFKPREVFLSGEVKNDTSHASLISDIDDFKKFVSGHYHGLRQFRMEFTDMADRYYMARFKSVRVKPIEPIYISMKYAIEIVLVLDQPFGIYNNYTFGVVIPLGSSPVSATYTHNGTAPARPRMRIENVGTSMSSIELINTAVRHRIRNIDTTESGLKWAPTGRWSDKYGAIWFDSAGSLYFPCKYNFNPHTFTVAMWIRWNSTSTAGYFFSTTSDDIYCRHDATVPAGIDFYVNVGGGITATIADSTSGFTTGEWFLVVCTFDGINARLNIYDLAADSWSADSVAATTYASIPTNFYVGTDASSANMGNKSVDDIRIYNRIVTGFDGVSYPEGSEKDVWEAANGPLPMDRGLTAYLPFDFKTDAKGWEYTSLIITETVAQNNMIELDCENHRAFLITATPEDSPAGIMDNVSGEFPFWIPDVNGLQVIHNGSASGLNLYVEENRRFI
jgi:hypothetical protein